MVENDEEQSTWFFTFEGNEGIRFGIQTPWGRIVSDSISKEDYRDWLISELLKYPRTKVPSGIRRAFGE